jgi:hypothetical protein
MNKVEPPIDTTINATEPKSAAKVSKPESISGKWVPGKGIKFHSLKYHRPPGRPRKRGRDPRNVIFY